MTTTVTLPRALMDRAKIAAIKRHVSFKAFVEQAIRDALGPKGGHAMRKEDRR